MIKAIKELTPRQLTILLLIIALGRVWYKLETTEAKDDGKDLKREERYDRLQSRLDSVQNLRVIEKHQHSKELAEKDLEMKRFILGILAEQKEVKSRVQRVEKSADNVFYQTKSKLSIQQQ